ncbi:MAG: hypothetical protein JWQ50_7893 [Caballeronia mineralivorans]|jgi:hypothetical protein|nr:hypothetical protein [Caballeronia mineralivorans]MEA3099430.1 hypothetical protein [Caballeronia mineralivorans]
MGPFGLDGLPSSWRSAVSSKETFLINLTAFAGD